MNEQKDTHEKHAQKNQRQMVDVAKSVLNRLFYRKYV